MEKRYLDKQNNIIYELRGDYYYPVDFVSEEDINLSKEEMEEMEELDRLIEADFATGEYGNSGGEEELDAYYVKTEDVNIGRYGSARKKFLMDFDILEYNRLTKEGHLNEYLEELDDECCKYEQRLVSQMQSEYERQGIMPNQNEEWDKYIGIINNFHHQAQEIVYKDMIYVTFDNDEEETEYPY